MDTQVIGRRNGSARICRFFIQRNGAKDFKKNELKPWQKKEWCIPKKENAAFVCQMEEVLDLYTQPYDPMWPVVCMDELNKQLVGEIRTPLPMESGKPRRYDSEYVRNGTANVFLAYEPITGTRLTEVTQRRTKVDWAYFIKRLIENYPEANKIRLVMDNLNTHTKPSLYTAFKPEEAKRLADKLEIHYTPKHGSWLNMAEIEFSHLGRQCLDRRIESLKILEKEVQAWTRQRNIQKIKTTWRFTTSDARIKLKKLYPSII